MKPYLEQGQALEKRSLAKVGLGGGKCGGGCQGRGGDPEEGQGPGGAERRGVRPGGGGGARATLPRGEGCHGFEAIRVSDHLVQRVDDLAELGPVVAVLLPAV